MTSPSENAASADLRRAVHDINNLLAVLQGHAEALARTMEASDFRIQHVEAIFEALQRSMEAARRLGFAAEGKSVPAADGAGRAPLPESLYGTETILLVDDEAPLRTVTGRFLSMNGYKVLEAGDGEEALDTFGRAEKVDVLVTDLVMKGIGGVELARRLRGSRPGIKVLFLSGHAVEEVRRQSGGELEGGFLQKPFRPKELILLLRSLLDAGRRGPA